MTDALELAPGGPASRVLLALRNRIDPTNPPMLIGAEARDILHRRLGHTFANRATRDVDLAFAIPDWAAYDRLVDGLDAIPDTGIAFRIDGEHVDVMAFGPVESPEGTLTPPFRPFDPLDVFGMRAVYRFAVPARYGDGPTFRLPSVAGYVALKLKAWIDRSARYEEKDAPDLGLALFWGAESGSFADRFWSDFDAVGRWEADVGLGGASLLGSDVHRVVGDDHATRLAELLTVQSRDQLARALGSARGPLELGDPSRRRALIDAMVDGLRGEMESA